MVSALNLIAAEKRPFSQLTANPVRLVGNVGPADAAFPGPAGTSVAGAIGWAGVAGLLRRESIGRAGQRCLIKRAVAWAMLDCAVSTAALRLPLLGYPPAAQFPKAVR